MEHSGGDECEGLACTIPTYNVYDLRPITSDLDLLVLCSRFNVMSCLKNISHNDQINHCSNPCELFASPREIETFANLVEHLATCLWIDEIWKHK